MSKKPFLPSPSPRPKLLCFGDPHGNFKYVVAAVQQHRPEAILLLGDLQAQRPLQLELEPILALTEVWFVHGNHDTDSDADHDNLFGSELAHRNLHGRVAQVAGLRVAGLGGVFRGGIWEPPIEPLYDSAADWLARHHPHEHWREGLALRHRSSIFPDEVRRLARQRADVLVTHEPLGGHPFGWNALDELAAAMGVQLVVHGHLHADIDYGAQGRLPTDARYQAFGVAPERFFAWPRNESDAGNDEPGSPDVAGSEVSP